MKKTIGLLFLFLMLCVLPFAGNAESSPFEGRNTRFDIPNRFLPADQWAERDAEPQEAQTPALEINTVVKPATRAEDIELIDGSVRTFGGRGNDRLIDVVAMKDGGFLLVGCTEIVGADSSTPQQTAWALRFSKDGEKLWEFTHQNKESTGYFDMAKETPDGSILLHYVNIFFNISNLRTHSLVTLSPEGELLEDAPMSSLVYKVYRSGDGIIIDSGSSLTKYSDDLVIQYELEDAALSHMEFSSEDGRLFYGYMLREQSYLGDAVVFMLNESGDILWDIIVQENARFEGSIKLADGDYLCTGFMENQEGRESGFAARISADGVLRYVREYSRPGEHFFVSHAYELEEGALLVGGSNKQNQIFLLTVDDDGNEIRRFAMNLGRRVELTSTPLRVLQGENQLFIVGDLVFYRTLLSPEDADFFVVPLELPLSAE